MSGENPILLLKTVITHSIAPSHAQTLTRGAKKKNPKTLFPPSTRKHCTKESTPRPGVGTEQWDIVRLAVTNTTCPIWGSQPGAGVMLSSTTR